MKRRKAEAATTQQKQTSPAPPQRPAPSPRKADRQPLPANQAPPLNSRRGAFLLRNAGQTFPAARTSPPSSPDSTNSVNFPNFLISLIAGFGRLPNSPIHMIWLTWMIWRFSDFRFFRFMGLWVLQCGPALSLHPITKFCSLNKQIAHSARKHCVARYQNRNFL